MKRPLLFLVAGCAGLMLSLAPEHPVVVAQQLEDFSLNPDLNMPPNRTHDDASLAVREARQRIYEAITLDSEGKKEDALNKWRDALGRYDNLRGRFLKPENWGNAEVLVRAEYPPSGVGNLRETIFTETWIPLVDHINASFREFEWPKALRDRFAMRQQAPGAEMLAGALARNDHTLLRRCARFYQFSDSGRTALAMLAEQAAESGDSLNALRWLEEYRKAWPDQFERDAMLNLLLVRACRETDSRLRLDQAVRRIESGGLNSTIDVGGVRKPLRDHVADLLASPAPSERRELQAPGWRTMQGNHERDRVAPPVAAILDTIAIGNSDKDKGFVLGQPMVKAEPDPYGGYRDDDSPAIPVIFPSAHESGVFLHRPQVVGQEGVEQLMWFRHGRESSPVPLEVPKALRYTVRPSRGGGGRWWGGRGNEQRTKSRVLASTIGRVRWPLDSRESDVLFAVMGVTSPQSERGPEPSGNQIQALDLSSDVSLRVTIPNRKVESAAEFGFLQHVTFMGAPIVIDNKLYIAGAIPDKASIEYWVFCFDVTPKGDPAAGEGKLLWRTQCCALANKQQAWGPQPITLTDMSSLAMQGGMLYMTTHAGATAGVDRLSGELCWVSRYRRPGYSTKGWFNNAPIAACGYLITAPYDSLAATFSEVALVLDGITGVCMFEQPRRGKGYKGEYEYMLGVVDNCMIIQGRSRLHCITLTSFRRGGGVNDADWGSLVYQSTEFKAAPIGRGIIAGDKVLVPFKDGMWLLDVRSGKLLSQYNFDNITCDGGPVTLTVYCRGEAYKDDEGLQRFKPVTVTDPVTGNVYNVEHLHNGAEYKFPSGATATVKKETFVMMASSARVYLFSARDN